MRAGRRKEIDTIDRPITRITFHADSVIIASEPLTIDATSWLEAPEYSMLLADTRDGRPMIDIVYLDV